MKEKIYCSFVKIIIVFTILLVATLIAADEVDWNGNNWALWCDFSGNNLSNTVTKPEDCEARCAATSQCTHYAWTIRRGGTCQMKRGLVSKTDAFVYYSAKARCGIIDRASEEDIKVSDESSIIFRNSNSSGKAKNENLSCTPSLTKMNNISPCQNTIIFEDDFYYINESKWLKVTKFSGEPDHEFVVYIPLNDILYTRNGILYMKPKRLESVYGENSYLQSLDLGNGCTSDINDDCLRQIGNIIIPPIISAQITTSNTFSFLYGKVEIRAKLPSENWIFPQLFLEPKNNFYGKQNLASGQMRVAFTKNRNGRLSGGVLLGSKEPYRSRKMCSESLIELSDDFHVFTLEWTEGYIKVAVDGQVYCRINPQSGFYTEFMYDVNSNHSSAWSRSTSKMAPFDKEFYLTFGVGVGGLSDFDDEPFLSTLNKPWNNTQVKAMKNFWNAMKPLREYPGDRSGLDIDYVKVYSL